MEEAKKFEFAQFALKRKFFLQMDNRNFLLMIMYYKGIFQITLKFEDNGDYYYAIEKSTDIFQKTIEFIKDFTKAINNNNYTLDYGQSTCKLKFKRADNPSITVTFEKRN